MTEPEDALDRFLRSARPGPPPEGLADRILAASTDSQRRRGLYWADVSQAARSGLVASAAGLLVAAGLAGITYTASMRGVEGQVADQTAELVEEIDPLTVSSQSVERQLATVIWPLDQED